MSSAQDRAAGAGKPTIGTLNEAPLHAALKAWFARPGDAMEVPLHGYIVDVVRDDFWVEVQTSNVSHIKRKLAALAEHHPVRLVLPVAQEKWIVRLGADGVSVVGRRKSPKRGAVELIYRELVSIPRLLAHPNFSLAVVLIQEEEVRRPDPTVNWRRNGWATVERRLIGVIETRVFETPADLAALLPDSLSEPFTARQLAAAIRQPVWLAQKMIYCLAVTEMMAQVGRLGRARTYTRNPCTTDLKAG
jgi:hypothetical protein